MEITSEGAIRIPIQVILDDQTKGGTGTGEGGSSGGLGTVQRAITNPLGLATGELATVMPFLVEALAAAGFFEVLLDKLTAPGGPYDRRFKRIMQNEVFDQFSLQEQQARRIGLDQVIITSEDGFRNHNGADVDNTLEQVKNFGTSNIGLKDRANRWNT